MRNDFKIKYRNVSALTLITFYAYHYKQRYCNRILEIPIKLLLLYDKR